MMTMTTAQARRFVLSKQGLLGKKRFVGKAGAYQYVRQAGCIQYDPVDVCGKNAELTLQSRVSRFSKQTLARLLYQDRLLVDYSDKELCIWPREDWPYFSAYRQTSRLHGQRFQGLAALEARALAYIREHGPVSSDTLPMEGKIFWHSSMHWSGHWQKESPAARSALEQLYTDGVLLIHHKTGARKYYDLAEKYFDAALLDAPCPCPDEASLLRWRIQRRIGAVGLLWNRNSDAWLGIPMTVQQRNEAFAWLEKAGDIVPVQAEGVAAPLYLLKEDLPLAEKARTNSLDTAPRLEFLAPLDPMLWDRKLVNAVWGFRYTWEIYTPPAKRKYGYYVLPMLWGERLIGRIEPAVDKQSNALKIKKVWLEEGVSPGKRLFSAMEKAAERLSAFNGCDSVQWEKGAPVSLSGK